MRLNDFQGKEVINACDGKKLGYIVDFVFDEKCGQIEAIIIPKTSKFCNFFCDGSEYIIPYNAFAKSDQMSYWQKCMRKNKKNLRKSPGNGSNSGLTSRTPQDILIRKDQEKERERI